MFIELKSGFEGNGPAWIGLAEFSKTGQTVYFNNKALKKSRTPGVSSNFHDIETGDEYWVSGIKKNGEDRHWTGSGKIFIEGNAVKEYLSLVDEPELKKSRFTIVDITPTDKTRFAILENKELD